MNGFKCTLIKNKRATVITNKRVYELVSYRIFNSKSRTFEGRRQKNIFAIVLYLIVLCVIMNVFQIKYIPEKVGGLMLAFIASILLMLITILVGKSAWKALEA